MDGGGDSGFGQLGSVDSSRADGDFAAFLSKFSSGVPQGLRLTSRIQVTGNGGCWRVGHGWRQRAARGSLFLEYIMRAVRNHRDAALPPKSQSICRCKYKCLQIAELQHRNSASICQSPDLGDICQ